MSSADAAVEGNATTIGAVEVNDAMCLELFTLKPIFDKQILKKIFGVSNKKEYFCSNKSHHASQRCVPRWDFAFYKGYMDYDKQPINVDEQVALLQNRGLVIEDIATAKLQLRNISYFRIASYLRYMEEDRQFQ